MLRHRPVWQTPGQDFEGRTSKLRRIGDRIRQEESAGAPFCDLDQVFFDTTSLFLTGEGGRIPGGQ